MNYTLTVIKFLMIQVTLGISNSDMSNTPDISNWVGGPGRIYYINDLRNLGYLEHGNLEYSGYLKVFFSPKHKFYLVYVELRLVFRSAKRIDLSSSSLIDETLNIFTACALCKCIYKSTLLIHNLLK